jgi:multidrug efflux pump subunit AcrA (membrane-fusion protein)
VDILTDATVGIHSCSTAHLTGGRLPAGHLPMPGASHPAHDPAWEAEAASAILDLALKVGQADDLRSAARSLANETKAHLQCDCVAVGLRSGRGGRCRLAAVSGVADPQGPGETLERLESALDEAILRDSMTVWPPSGDTPRDEAVAHRDLALHLRSDGLISVPLRAADNSVLGAWILVGSGAFVHHAPNQRFVDAASPAMGMAMEIAKRAQRGPIRRALRRVTRASSAFRRKLLAAVGAVLLGAMLVPVPYYVSAECELQPVVRRFIAAPHAGEFQKSLVKPGDLVACGQILGRMDGREIRWELAGLTAEQERARKSRDVNMAGGKTAAAQIDELDAQRQQVRSNLLEERFAHLEIKSPIDGIVVSGDLQRSEGVPVSVGQVLYEVAPLDRLTAELAIADEEISLVAEDMPVSLRFDAHPDVRWDGPIARIHPRSVTREKDNVFLGEIVLDNAEGTLRPGMKGHAHVRAANQSLGWVVFHKPWNYLRSWLDF